MNKKILIVDDDRDLVASLAQVLKGNGYDVAAAFNGADGLKAAPRRAARPRHPRRHDGDGHGRLRGGRY
ncbi:MAG: hypothetical protein M0C28_07520, partial [Candidatus Moduliflexus flocculans]|nr:hypothetical protein [Candidatus Moduliflexus flocculans]